MARVGLGEPAAQTYTHTLNQPLASQVLAMPTIEEIASLLPPPREGTHVADPTASGLVRTHTGIGSQAGLTPQEAANLRPALSYYENLAVGVGGGCVETAALMPVLTWKFCAQEGRALPKLPHSLASIAPWCHARREVETVVER